MESKWIKHKEEAIALRRQGTSMTLIEKRWGIARSTLSVWFKNIELTEGQKEKLRQNSIGGSEKGREKAVAWHNEQKRLRLEKAKSEALETFSKIDLNDKSQIELALAFLYLGEGAKGDDTSLGNSNPMVLKFFLKCMDILYGIKPYMLKYTLHIRSDQNDKELIKYWSKELHAPTKNFNKTLIDKRTIKSKTYPHYKGVCVINCGRVAIQRKLLFLSQEFCDRIVATDG